MTKKEKQIVRECAEATKLHLRAIAQATPTAKLRAPFADVIEGMQITWSKLDYLLEEAK